MDSAKEKPRRIEDLCCQLLEKRIGMGAETLRNFHHFGGGVVETPKFCAPHHQETWHSLCTSVDRVLTNSSTLQTLRTKGGEGQTEAEETLQMYSKVLQNLAEALRYNTLEKMGRRHLVRDDHRFSLPPQTINRESWPTVDTRRKSVEVWMKLQTIQFFKKVSTPLSNPQLQIPKTTTSTLQDTSFLPVSRKLWTLQTSPPRVLTLHFSIHSTSFKL